MLYRIKYRFSTSNTIYAGPIVGETKQTCENYAYVEAPNVARAVSAVYPFIKEQNIVEIIVLSEKVYHAS